MVWGADGWWVGVFGGLNLFWVCWLVTGFLVLGWLYYFVCFGWWRLVCGLFWVFWWFRRLFWVSWGLPGYLDLMWGWYNILFSPCFRVGVVGFDCWLGLGATFGWCLGTAFVVPR